MTKLSNRLSNYTDCQRAFEVAAASGSSTVLFDRRGSAVHWRHRAYKFRALFREATDKAYEGTGREPMASPWDQFQIDIEERPGTSKPWVCLIRPRPEPMILDDSGNKVDPLVGATIIGGEADDIV